MNKKQAIFTVLSILGAGTLPLILMPELVLQWLIGYGVSALLILCIVGAVGLYEWLGN